LTALQAVLAGIGGGASGYIQQEEMKRKRMKEEQDRARQEAMDAERRTQYEAAQKRQAAMDLFNIASSGKAVEVQEEPAGLPPSVIPLPRADQVGGRTGVDVAGRRFAVLGTDELAQRAAAQDEAGFERRLQLQRQYAAPTRKTGDGETDDTKLRTAYVNKYFTETGEMPNESQVKEYLRLVKGGSSMSDIFTEEAPAAPRAAAPTMPQAGGGLFERNMFSAPAAAQPASAQPASDMDEIRALAARLAKLKRGGTFGTIAEREQYERNADERRRVQRALDEAFARYRSSR